MTPSIERRTAAFSQAPLSRILEMEPLASSMVGGIGVSL